jgi:hypothetical protein
VIAEIPGRRKKRWATVLVTAVTGEAPSRNESLVDPLFVIFVQRERKQGCIVCPMLALSQPSPNYDSRDGWLFEHPARGHIGNGHTVLASNLVHGRQNRLEGRPPSDGVDEAFVL